MKKFASLLIAGSLAVLSASAFAQAFPSKTIRLITPYPPGGSTDAIARIIAPALGNHLGQTVLVDNKGGAGGTIGTVDALKSAPDGYTIAISSLSTVACNPAINPDLPYKISDITPIVTIAASATMIATNPNFPVKNYQELIAELKRHPGKYSYGSSGVGGVSHLQMERWKSLADVFVTHIPYRGAGPALTDAIAGRIELVMDATPSILPFIKSGKLRPIVVASDVRLKELPDVPTFTEVGLPQMNKMSTFGIIGPKGMPADVVNKINAAVRASLADPTVLKRLAETGLTPVGDTPAQFASDIKDSFAEMKKIVVERKLHL